MLHRDLRPNRAGGPPPVKLQLNLVLPGRGSVELGAPRLVQYDTASVAAASAGSMDTAPATGWWSAQTGNLFGALAGSFSFGVVSLVAGIAALCLSQGYFVYYPLLAAGRVVNRPASVPLSRCPHAVPIDRAAQDASHGCGRAELRFAMRDEG